MARVEAMAGDVESRADDVSLWDFRLLCVSSLTDSLTLRVWKKQGDNTDSQSFSDSERKSGLSEFLGLEDLLIHVQAKESEV